MRASSRQRTAPTGFLPQEACPLRPADAIHPLCRQAVGSVSDVLAARAAQRAELAMSGTAGQEEEGEEMCDAALRVALDVVGITLFARDFGASKYGDCRILEVRG